VTIKYNAKAQETKIFEYTKFATPDYCLPITNYYFFFFEALISLCSVLFLHFEQYLLSSSFSFFSIPDFIALRIV